MVEEYYELFFKLSFVFLLAGISDYFREKVELECNCMNCNPDDYTPNEELEKFKEEIITSVREEVRALVEDK